MPPPMMTTRGIRNAPLRPRVDRRFRLSTRGLKGAFLMPRVVIIGGGISGLSTAYSLSKGNASATIIESRPRLGGVIRTEKIDGCTIEAGPDSFLSIKPAAMDLIAELGLRDDVIGSNDHLRITYVRKGGKLVPLPDGLMMMV